MYNHHASLAEPRAQPLLTITDETAETAETAESTESFSRILKDAARSQVHRLCERGGNVPEILRFWTSGSSQNHLTPPSLQPYLDRAL